MRYSNCNNTDIATTFAIIPRLKSSLCFILYNPIVRLLNLELIKELKTLVWHLSKGAMKEMSKQTVIYDEQGKGLTISGTN